MLLVGSFGHQPPTSGAEGNGEVSLNERVVQAADDRSGFCDPPRVEVGLDEVGGPRSARDEAKTLTLGSISGHFECCNGLGESASSEFDESDRAVDRLA